jgi:hypothetical protein
MASTSSKTPPTMTTTRLAAAAVDRPFRAWESPITSKSIPAGSFKIDDLHLLDNDNKRNLIWLEGRPQEAGKERNSVDDANLAIRVEIGLHMAQTKVSCSTSQDASRQLI